jgi:exosortase/archaeosortase family protein
VLFEQFVIQSLMRAVTAINVTLLNIAGIPALRHGNLIEVGSGYIGIEEACSGVRSLQATLMVSLFLGDLYSFTKARRLLLVLAGVALAFLCNVARTAILVGVGAKRGYGALEAWHDPAGLTILLVCLFGLWCVSLLMGRDRSAASSPFVQSGNRPIHAVPVIALALAGWMLIAEVGVQLWYHAHRSPFDTTRWTVNWPTGERAYKIVGITPEAEGLLHFHDGGGANWRGSDDREWTMYFFRWLPGQTAARYVKIHRPDICLPASGMTLEKDAGLRLINVNGVNLPMRSYRFNNAGTNLHVFYCYWDARSSYDSAATAVQEDWSARGRIQAALRGQRDRGAQMLEIAVSGFEDDTSAEEAMRRQLSQIVRG